MSQAKTKRQYPHYGKIGRLTPSEMLLLSTNFLLLIYLPIHALFHLFEYTLHQLPISFLYLHKSYSYLVLLPAKHPSPQQGASQQMSQLGLTQRSYLLQTQLQPTQGKARTDQPRQNLFLLLSVPVQTPYP